MQKLVTHAPAILLAAFLVMMGAQKFGPENIIFATIAEKSGIALFEPVIRMATGAAELATALLLIFPRTRAPGALAAIGVIGGAIGFHLSPWLGVNVAMTPGSQATPTLFFMAIGSFALALVTLYIASSRRA